MTAYWVNSFRAIHDEKKLAAYIELGGQAMLEYGGRFLARGPAAAAFELGERQRTSLILFDDVETAVAAYESPSYRKALDALGDGADRDIRMVAGIDGVEPKPGKSHWVSIYRAINDPDRMAAYAELALPALEAAGGRFVARGTAAAAYEHGLLERVVVIEFESVDAAVAAYGSPDYRTALDALGDGADRDIRILAPTG